MPAADDTQHRRAIQRDSVRFRSFLFGEQLDLGIRKILNVNLDLGPIHRHHVFVFRTGRRTFPNDHQHVLFSEHHRVMFDRDPPTAPFRREPVSPKTRDRLGRRIDHEFQAVRPRIEITPDLTLDVRNRTNLGFVRPRFRMEGGLLPEVA